MNVKDINPMAHNIKMLSAGDLVTEYEAAAILCVSVQTLRNWRWQGRGPRFSKIGKRLIRYNRADLTDFVICGNVSKDAA